MSVNFPLVASVLADLETENIKYKTAISLATGAISISVIALVLSLFASNASSIFSSFISGLGSLFESLANSLASAMLPDIF